MITLRTNKERHFIRRRKQEMWLTFYPEDRKDPLAGGFELIEVFNENRLPPGGGVVPHPRHEAEIITYVFKGALAQDDSTGRSGIINAGEFQRMTTGRLVRYSEQNASEHDWAHIFQIWLSPSVPELDHSVEQNRFSTAQRRGMLRIIASPDGRKGSLLVHQDALIYSSILDLGQHVVHALAPGRAVWLHIVKGEATSSDLVLVTGDGIGVVNEPSVSLTAREETEILLIDINQQPSYALNGGTP